MWLQKSKNCQWNSRKVVTNWRCQWISGFTGDNHWTRPQHQCYFSWDLFNLRHLLAKWICHWFVKQKIENKRKKFGWDCLVNVFVFIKRTNFSCLVFRILSFNCVGKHFLHEGAYFTFNKWIGKSGNQTIFGNYFAFLLTFFAFYISLFLSPFCERKLELSTVWPDVEIESTPYIS